MFPLLHSFRLYHLPSGRQKVETFPRSNCEARGHVRQLRRDGWRKIAIKRRDSGITVTAWFSPWRSQEERLYWAAHHERIAGEHMAAGRDLLGAAHGKLARELISACNLPAPPCEQFTSEVNSSWALSDLGHKIRA